MNNGFLFDHITAFEIIYLISALLAALLIPITNAADEKQSARSAKSVKYFLTYGHILKGLVGALIPVVNTIAVAMCIGTNISGVVDRLKYVKVFKERIRD